MNTQAYTGTDRGPWDPYRDGLWAYCAVCTTRQKWVPSPGEKLAEARCSRCERQALYSASWAKRQPERAQKKRDALRVRFGMSRK